MTFAEAVAKRLRDRAETAARNAHTYAAAGYAGEALRQNERAQAFALAAEDVEQIAREYEATATMRDPLVRALRDIAEHDGCEDDMAKFAKRGVW